MYRKIQIQLMRRQNSGDFSQTRKRSRIKMRHIGHTSLNKTGPGAVSLRDQRTAMAPSWPYQLLTPFLGTNPAARSPTKANYSDPE